MPEPKLMPPLAAAPERTMIVLAPIVAIVCMSDVREPWLISTMAITAPTPMITPSAVSADRILLRRRAVGAVRSGAGTIAAQWPMRTESSGVARSLSVSAGCSQRSPRSLADCHQRRRRRLRFGQDVASG